MNKEEQKYTLAKIVYIISGIALIVTGISSYVYLAGQGFPKGYPLAIFSSFIAIGAFMVTTFILKALYLLVMALISLFSGRK